MGILSQRLLALMQERGIKQIALARAVQIPQPHLSKYLRGREPRGENILKIARYFNVSVDYLMGKTDIKSDDKPLLTAMIEGVLKEERAKYALRKDMPEKDKKLGIAQAIEKLEEIKRLFVSAADRMDEIINIFKKIDA